MSLDTLFDAAHRLDPAALRALDRREKGELSLMAAGQRPTEERVRSLEALAIADPASALKVLGAVTAERREDDGVRAAAAINLGRLGPKAERPLLAALRGRPGPASRARLVQALGKVGGKGALAALRAEASGRDPQIASRARFAAWLVGARLGTDPGVDRPPLPPPFRPSPDQAAAIAVERAPAAEVRAAVERHGFDTYGMPVDESVARRLQCGPLTWLLLPNPQLLGGDAGLAERPAIGALLARRSPVDETYAVTMVALTRPAERGGFEIVVHRPSGREVLAGGGTEEGGVLGFDLAAVEGAGNAAVRVTGRVERGQVQLDQALSSLQVAQAEAPTPQA